jgi:Fe-S cluster biogenesis protein NfuA
MIPIHATATADPQQLRWVIAADRLPSAGTVRRAPGRLGALLDGGVIDEMVVRTADVLITLRAGNSWREHGDDVREALCEALLDLAGWRVDASPDDTAPLTAIAAELLAGPIGALAESHGGSIELVSVDGNNVNVRMSGACHGCPAASSTLHDTLQRELRQLAGQKITVSSENNSSAVPLGRKLLSLMVRRGPSDQSRIRYRSQDRPDGNIGSRNINRANDTPHRQQGT